MSVFQRQAHLTAGTVIDAENLPHMTVGRAAGILLRQLGDGFRVCPCQLLHQALPAILALVYGDEAGHTTDYTGKVGIHIAPPRLVDDAKHLDVALTAIPSQTQHHVLRRFVRKCVFLKRCDHFDHIDLFYCNFRAARPLPAWSIHTPCPEGISFVLG